MPPIDDQTSGEHEYDVASMVKEISEGMFPAADPPSKDGGEEDTSSVADPKPVPEVPGKESVTTPPSPALGADGKPIIDPVAQLNQELPLPKSWKKEQQAIWDKADKDLRARITEREAEMSRGISMYQQGYKAWDEVTKPFAPLLQQNPNVNPVQLFQNLMQNHLALLNPATKAAKAKELLQAYGLDPATLEAVAASAPAAPPPADPRLLARIDSIEKTFQEQMVAEQERLVNAFFSDPKNKYADEVAPDIVRLLQTGAAPDLQTAYQQALWLNPAVRQKLVDEQFAERQKAALDEAKKAEQAAKLNRGGNSAREPGKKPASMDETINSVIAKHYPQH